MAISADMVKELREATGAAVLDCKKALEQFEGDMDKAKAFLAEKGLATAAKKADRSAREGVIETYTHPGARVGVMVEVNCETDFVARNEKFKTFAHEVALHIAFASPAYVDVADIPAKVVEEKRAEFTKEGKARDKKGSDLESFVNEEIEKFYVEVALLKQPFVKDEKRTISDLLTATIAETKENMRISRFARFELGSDGSDGGGEE